MKAIFTSLCILCFAITSAQNFDAGLIGGFCTSQVSGDNLSGYNKLDQDSVPTSVTLSIKNELSAGNAIPAKRK